MKLFETEDTRGKTHPVTLEQVAHAYDKVKSNGGAEGVDGVTLDMLKGNKQPLLYKLWNRLASGSYFPQAVRGVEIPKTDGTKRLLGIPTVLDRVAQEVARSVMEPTMEKVFHGSSYGYRPHRSAHDAVTQCQRNCHEYRWVIDLDIQGFFDNIDHDLMMQVVEHYFTESWLRLYIKRWLQCSMKMPDGTMVNRSKGTPQGGVISPLLANMFLHVVFDAWLSQHVANKKFGTIHFERYADDIIVHCRTEREAQYLLIRIRERMKECRLALHPGKTKIVYCKQSNRRGKHEVVKFEFLGFEFSPDRVPGSEGKSWLGYMAKVGGRAKRYMKQQFERLKIHRATGATLPQMAAQLAAQTRGWIRYYGVFRPSELSEVFSALNERLVRWYTNKYKRYRRRIKEARNRLQEDYRQFPNLFVHWQYGYTP
jgi:group II intron reverse transcriptase/maturase